MILTNEQRAHDLAVSVTNYQLNNIHNVVDPAEAKSVDGKLVITKNVIDMYLENYNTCLNAMNRNFND